MTIYKHFIGHIKPDMPEKAVELGGLTIKHMTRTEYEHWYSDDPENDRPKFNAEKQKVEARNKTTMPPIWA